MLEVYGFIEPGAIVRKIGKPNIYRGFPRFPTEDEIAFHSDCKGFYRIERKGVVKYHSHQEADKHMRKLVHEKMVRTIQENGILSLFRRNKQKSKN